MASLPQPTARRAAESADRANVFVIGLDPFNRRLLETLPGASRCRVHGLLTIEELQHGPDIPVLALLDRAERELRSFDGRIDAIVSYWDFPATLMAAVLRERLGLPGSRLRTLLASEHKYWSRLIQREVTDACPRFSVVEPFDPRPRVDLDFPFWIKPVKSASSTLALRVHDEASFQDAIAQLRRGLARFAEALGNILALADLPREVADLSPFACIAEEESAGSQHTLEGYVHRGAVHSYGVVDSLHYPATSSFERYAYPSQLSDDVQARMHEAAQAVISATGLDDSPFNIEFFWDAAAGQLRLLEINPRQSQSHARLFELVDGAANHQVMVELALGRDPQMPHRSGPCAAAAKWYLRRFGDGVVTRVPTAEEIAELERELAFVDVRLDVAPGDRLAVQYDQDAYSYKLAHLYLGAPDRAALDAKIAQSAQRLRFEIAPADERVAAAPALAAAPRRKARRGTRLLRTLRRATPRRRRLRPI